MRYRIIVLFIIIITLLYQGNVIAQDNHDYLTPLGRSLYYNEVIDANRTTLSMNEVNPITEGSDGLCVVFSFMTDLSKLDSQLKLLSFTLSTEQNSFLDLFYNDGTFVIRRKINSGSPSFYDYNLYDPMFSVESGVTKWEIHLFFTGYFIWLESRSLNMLLHNKWHSPVFFGINLPNCDNMQRYLDRSENAKIVFGDSNTSAVFTMPDEIAIHEFRYSELRDELQRNFCNSVQM